jgi:hypothetical protein
MSLKLSRVIANTSLAAFGSQMIAAAKEARFSPGPPQMGAAPAKPPLPGAPALPAMPAPNTPRGALLDLSV